MGEAFIIEKAMIFFMSPYSPFVLNSSKVSFSLSAKRVRVSRAPQLPQKLRSDGTTFPQSGQWRSAEALKELSDKGGWDFDFRLTKKKIPTPTPVTNTKPKTINPRELSERISKVAVIVTELVSVPVFQRVIYHFPEESFF